VDRIYLAEKRASMQAETCSCREQVAQKCGKVLPTLKGPAMRANVVRDRMTFPALGFYAPSWFGAPTASSQYLQASQANMGPYRRGAGTIFFPGPGRGLAGLGQDSSSVSVDPNLLMWGVGLLVVGSFFLGGRVEPQRRVREKSRAYYQKKLRELNE
jgi:hypothetical protein